MIFFAKHLARNISDQKILFELRETNYSDLPVDTNAILTKLDMDISVKDYQKIASLWK